MSLRLPPGLPVSICFLVMFAAGCGSSAVGEVVPGQTGSGSEISVDNVLLSWQIGDSNIEFDFTAPTTGWIAVGFDPTAAMKDADIIIGYVSGDGSHIRDDWGDGFTSHRPDTEIGGTDDVTLISGNEEDGTTRLIFSIPLSSGDSYDKELAAGEAYKILLAYGPDDADNFQGYHAWVKVMEIEL